MSFSIQTCDSPVGKLYLVGRGDKLCAIYYEKMRPHFTRRFPDAKTEDTPVLAATRQQLTEYFAGRRQEFDLPLELHGTEFQKKVWTALLRIPFGETKTYGEQADYIQSPGAARAVGRADGLNPLSIVLPCHRVVASNGALTGYAGGLEAKAFLLALESPVIRPRARTAGA